MSMVRFATLCDKCGRRSWPEYTAWASCIECKEDTFDLCDDPEMRTDDESHKTQCNDCARGLNLVIDHTYTPAQYAAALAFTMGIMEHPERVQIGRVRFL